MKVKIWDNPPRKEGNRLSGDDGRVPPLCPFYSQTNNSLNPKSD